MQQEELQELVRKYIKGTATDVEKRHLSEWYQDQHLSETEWLADVLNEEHTLKQEMFDHIQQQISEKKNSRIQKLWPRIAAAASVLLCLSIGGYLYLNKTKSVQLTTIKPGVFKNDVQPGSNNAILTLSNGQQIILKNSKVGLLANQGNTIIQKTADGELRYNSSDTRAAITSIVYNTVTTKRSDKYDVTLPDGTIAYLDAASSIHFPTVFSGNDREVDITGQVYFEVAHDKTKPFRVKVKDEVVEVLGTHFNINAFDDEPVVKTTLLEGSVKISRTGQTVLLVPGEQAQVKGEAAIKVSNQIDLDEVMAWRKGLFKFNNTELTTVMRQLSRWYDVDVEYQGPEKAYHFGGYMSRDSKLTSILKILQLNGVNFSIDGKKLIVYR